MKKSFAFFLVLISFQSFANEEFMTVKERLRLSLWFEGLDSGLKQQDPKAILLPEELEKVLKKI